MTPTPKPKNLEEVIDSLLKNNKEYFIDDKNYTWLAYEIAKATIKAIVPDKKKLLSKEEVTLSLEIRILSGEFANDIRGRWNDCRSEMKKRAGEWVGDK